ncbi:MAG: SUMF1/EgtB/PvdO family nonheme iron enzyme [Bacteroidota bacterium]|nr:SUMF1/EgtB/PvdO family nonheme iron enzyme [Bacteroidota bacterium]
MKIIIPIIILFVLSNIISCKRNSPTENNTISPEVKIILPADNTNEADSIFIEISAKDDRGIDKIEIYVDNKIDTVLNQYPYKYYILYKKYSNSYSHTLSVIAYDINNNFAKSSQIQFSLISRFPELLVEWIVADGGTFDMGSENGTGLFEEYPQHKVTVKSFKICKTEVTFDLYDQFCRETFRSKPNDGGWGRTSMPAINVNWFDAKEFCAWASLKTGKIVRLPTEAEWEFAAQGGIKAHKPHYIYSGSDNIDSVSWYYNYIELYSPHPVATKTGNELGIHDMSGNVWEWCEDFYHSDYDGAPTDGSAWLSPIGIYRIVRGGSWYYGYNTNHRVAHRAGYSPGSREVATGFRVVTEP